MWRWVPCARLARTACTIPALGLHASSQQSRCETTRPSFSPDLFGDDIPSQYKSHFTQAYDAQAGRGGEAANVAKRNVEHSGDGEIRAKIAWTLMTRLGYTEEELKLVGAQDMLRMQGVGSPFPLACIETGDTVLDLGSGFGIDAFLAAEKAGQHGHVIGIDLSAEEVQKARTRLAERGLAGGRCEFLEGDMEKLPFKDEMFDVVISNGGFCLVPDKKRAFEEIYRVLRPGGRFAVACTVLRSELPPLPPPKRWPPCMEVFLKHADAKKLVETCKFIDPIVDDSNAAMDVWELDDAEISNVAQELNSGAALSSGGCSHAKKAAERRARERVSEFLSRDREAGVHWGNPEFDHIHEFDMNKLCARVVISAQKPRRH